MNPPTRLRFARCEIDLLRRELLVDGQERPLPRKVYELLALLLRLRDRVVTRDELAAELWPGTTLSESVLARNVWLVRQAIGDSGRQPQCIVNHHGVGYRFAAPVQEVFERRSEALPLAVLPCVNDTGDARLGWVEQGLMALLTHALQPDPAAALACVAEVLERWPLGAVVPAAADDAAVRALGCAGLLQLSLSQREQPREGEQPRDGEGRLSLSWQLRWCEPERRPRVQQGAGCLRGDEACELAGRLARQLITGQAAGTDPAEPPPTDLLPSPDAFVNETFARGIARLFDGDLAQAGALLLAVRTLVPADAAAQWWLRVFDQMQQQARGTPRRKLRSALASVLRAEAMHVRAVEDAVRRPAS